MNMTPRVTICVPVYNCEQFIDHCIASALDQSYSDFECLVIDNVSTDSTLDRVMALDDPRIRVLRNTENIGAIANENRCIREAKGDLIQFLHGDDRLLPDCLSRLVPTFDDPSVGLAFARRRIESRDPRWATLIGTLHTPLEPLGRVNDGKNIVRRYVDGGAKGNWIGEPTSVMLRRSILTEVGGFDTRPRSYCDMELWLRVLARSNAAWVDSELSVRTQHSENLSALLETTDEAWLDRGWILNTLARNPDLDRHTRMKAGRQWIVAAIKNCGHAQLAPRGLRRTKYRQLGHHLRESLSAKPAAQNTQQVPSLVC
jgi:glycosyltransferase involved in cell wall biosynthesis